MRPATTKQVACVAEDDMGHYDASKIILEDETIFTDHVAIDVDITVSTTLCLTDIHNSMWFSSICADIYSL